MKCPICEVALDTTIREQAELEVVREEYRRRVEAEKERIRTGVPLWHSYFPWKITITRRTKSNG